MAIVNKDLIQSYIMTTAKYDFNVYEKRIIYRIVDLTINGNRGTLDPLNY